MKILFFRCVVTDSETEDDEVSPKADLMKENEINDGSSVNEKATT